VVPGVDPRSETSEGRATGEGNLDTGFHETVADTVQDRRGSHSDLVQAILRISQQRTSLNRRDLANLSGDAFDRAFMHHQVFFHAQLLSVWDVLDTYASPQLRQVIDDGEAMDQQHLTQARRIIRVLDGTRRGSPQVPAGDTRDDRPANRSSNNIQELHDQPRPR
jgi:hypothetical protein